ncbi:MAG TPA: CBS domain-containing protein [Pyrinomonadaceae bacterium]|nr:CBS domain-containing protein [Pyrinomonadaceae bacterium]
MSRNRYDRDDRDYYGGLRGEDRYGQERGGGYGRGSGALDRDLGFDESYGARRGGGGGANMGGGGRYYGREDYGRADYGRTDYGRGGYGERADYRPEERRYAGYSGGTERRQRGDDRSWYEEARDYFTGRDEGRARGGATRSHVRCRDIMTRDVTVATRATSLLDVAAMMRDEDTGVIPVVEHEGTQTTEGNGGNGRANRMKNNGKLVGLITDRDIVIRAVAEGKDSRTARAEEVMTTDLHSAHPNDRVVDVIRKMGDKQVRRIPVVDDNDNLLGIISMADVALETEEDRELADALEDISSGSSFWSKIFG